MKKYTWNFNEDAEIWDNGMHDTIEECIRNAMQEVEETDWAEEEQDPPVTVFIGECDPFVPHVDGETVLDMIEEQASEFCGEYGDEWDAYDRKKRDELDELDTQLTAVVVDWMKKHGYSPDFYAIEDITEHTLPEAGNGV